MSAGRRSVLGLLVAAAAVGPGVRAAEAALAALADPANPDGVLGVGVVARDGRGRVRLAEAHGRGVLGEGDGRRERPFTLDTPVRVASISKLVAMSGLMRLVERGRARLDADVSEALGWRLRHPAHPGAPITAAMLASHTSGLRNGADYPVPVGRRLQDVLTPGGAAFEADWFAPAAQPPGFFAYADVNFAVLAQVMERASGERFDRLIRRTVLVPAGVDAGYNWSGVSQAARDRASAACRRVAGAWTAQTDAVVPSAPGVRVLAAAAETADDYRIGENGFAFSPQGGLRASVRDLDRLAQAFRRDLRVARMARPLWTHDGANGDTTRGYYRAYGLGVQIPLGVEGPGGDAFFGRRSTDWRGHFGEAYGLVSGLWWNVRDGRTLAYVINGLPREASASPGRRSAATPWEETVIDAALNP